MRQKTKVALALHFIDLNGFKQINDAQGHDGGNVLLVQVADRLHRWVGNTNFVGRFGGDEFVVIQYGVSEDEPATKYALELRSAISICYKLDDQEIILCATVGTALIPSHATNCDAAIKAADIALYKAKENQLAHCKYDPAIAAELQAKLRIEEILKSAIADGQVLPYFHSIVCRKNPLNIVGFEALARVKLPDGNLMMPQEFISIAENTGQIIKIGKIHPEAGLC